MSASTEAPRSTWRRSLPTTLLVFVFSAIGGAALFAGTHPSQVDAYRGSATVLVLPPHPPGESLAQRTQRLAAVLRSPEALEEARTITATRIRSAAEGNVADAHVDPADGIVVVSLTARTSQEAVITTNALVARSIELATAPDVRPTREGARIIGDFELGFDAWQIVGTDPAAVTLDRAAGGRRNAVTLRIECRPSSVCGSAREVVRPFESGGSYAVSFWARSPREGTSLAYSLGSGTDLAQGDATIGREWSRHVVRWTPARDARQLFVTVQINAPQATTFDLDGVVIMDSRSPGAPVTIPLPDAAEARLFRGHVSAIARPAVAVRVKGNPTARWALAGAVAGIATAGALLGAATAAARRRQRV